MLRVGFVRQRGADGEGKVIDGGSDGGAGLGGGPAPPHGPLRAEGYARCGLLLRRAGVGGALLGASTSAAEEIKRQRRSLSLDPLSVFSGAPCVLLAMCGLPRLALVPFAV